MEDHQQKDLQILDKYQDSNCKKSLVMMMNYVVNRKILHKLYLLNYKINKDRVKKKLFN